MSKANITSNSANKSKKSSRKNESSHVMRIQKVIDGIKMLVTNTVIEQSSEQNVLTKLDLNDLQPEQHAVAWHTFTDAKYDLLPIYYEIGSETQQLIRFKNRQGLDVSKTEARTGQDKIILRCSIKAPIRAIYM